MLKFYLFAKEMFNGKQEGATMVEYGLMVSLIAVACIVAVTAMSTALSNTFTNAALAAAL